MRYTVWYGIGRDLHTQTIPRYVIIYVITYLRTLGSVNRVCMYRSLYCTGTVELVFPESGVSQR
jgi:hypothetical protein